MDFRDEVNDILSHCTEAFGEVVTFFPEGGGIHKIRAIFNNEFQTLDLDTQQVVMDTQPNLGVNLNDFKFEIKAKCCDVEVRGMLYRVIDKHPDGQGGAILMLHRKNKNERIPDTTTAY